VAWGERNGAATSRRRQMSRPPDAAAAREPPGQHPLTLPGLRRLVIGFCLRLNMALLVAAFVSMLVSGLAQVAFRYLINRPLSWTEEMARFSFVWIVFLGAALGVHYASHLGVDVLLNSLKPRLRLAIVTLTQGLVLAMLVVLIRESVEVSVFNMAQISPALELPMGIPYTALPAGFVLMLVYTLNTVVENLAVLLGNPEKAGDEQSAEGNT
jgi:TRAP-type C4-dicarboxylate transport system permease small subunit